MTTRMVHPQHGATHAYDTGEIQRLEKLGWSVEKPAVMGSFSAHARGGYPVPDVVQFYEAPPIERKKPGPKPKAK